MSAETVRNAIELAKSVLANDPTDQLTKFSLLLNEYVNNWGLRGDNTPESAKYLGYLDFKELYPGVGGKTMRTVIQEVLDGRKDG